MVDTTAITGHPITVNTTTMRRQYAGLGEDSFTHTGVQDQRDRLTDALPAALDALEADPTLHLSRTRQDPVNRMAEGLHQWGHAALLAEHTGQDAELEALLALTDQLVADAETVAATAETDWHDPDVSRRISGQMLPHPDQLAAVAQHLREVIRRPMAMPVPHPQAQRLAALAEQIHPQA